MSKAHYTILRKRKPWFIDQWCNALPLITPYETWSAASTAFSAQCGHDTPYS